MLGTKLRRTSSSVRTILIGAVGLLLLSCGKSPQGPKAYSIAVIPKGTTHEFWKSIHAGALRAARELKAQGTEVALTWKGPLREDDREQQIQVVEGFTSQGINGIVLAPLDSRALVRPVEEAGRAGIPTVIIDSGLESGNIVSFVATDNLRGGELAAERMGALLQGKGKVLMLRYQEGSASTEQREEGFITKLKANFPSIEVISSDQYAGPTRDTAKRASENLLNRFGNEIQGILPERVCDFENVVSPAGHRQSREGGLPRFRRHSDVRRRNAQQAASGSSCTESVNMGYLGVKTMVEHLMGKPVAKRVDTGVTMITPENMDTPESQTLLHPPVE